MGLLFLLFNELSFSNNRWTLHPDDHDLLVFSKVLLKTGHLWYETPYNEKYRTGAFQPSLNNFQSDRSDRYAVRAAYSPGIYIISSPGHLFGLRGPFFIVSMLGLTCILFLYLFVKEIFGRAEAVVSAVFLGLSAPYIYWSNMLFTNIPALAFLTGGLFFLAKTVSNPGKRTYYFLTVVLFVFSVWMRYEYVLLVFVIALVALIAYRRRFKGKLVLQSAVVLLAIVAIILAANYITSGSVTGTYGAMGAGKQSAGDLLNYIPELPGPRVLLTNAKMYVFGVAPILVLLGIVGIVLALKQNRNGFTFILVSISVLVLFLYGKSAGFWGYDKNWLASSYTRYFLPLFMCLSILAGACTVRFREWIPWRRIATAMAVAILLVHMITSLFVLYDNQFGIEFTDLYCGNRRSVDIFVSSLPPSAVIVDLSSDNYFRFDIISRVVLNPSYFGKRRAEQRLARILEDLGNEGIPTYIINNPERSMLNLKHFTDRYDYIVFKTMKHSAVFQYGSKTPDIYQVEVLR